MLMEVAGFKGRTNHQPVPYHDKLLTYTSTTVLGSLVEDLARQTGAALVFPYYTPAP